MIRIYKLSFIIWLLYFFTFFYNSFYHGEDIKIFSLETSVIESLIIFYVGLCFYFYMFVKHGVLEIKKQKEFYIFYLFSSLCLVMIGEYTFFIFLIFAFLVSIIRFKELWITSFIDFSLFVVFNYALVLVFASSSYLLFFFDLSVYIYFYYKKENSFSKTDILIYAIFSLLFILNTPTIETLFYEIFTWLDIVDEVNHVNEEILYILISLNILILSVLRYNREKL